MPREKTQHVDATKSGFPPLPYSPENLENDVSYEVTHLEYMVSKSLTYLQNICSQMDRVEQELRGFLDDYYAQVGDFFEELEVLKRQIAEYDRKIYQASPKRRRAIAQLHGVDAHAADLLRQELPAVPSDLRQDEWEGEMKAIYHRLVKLYHPDVSHDVSCSTRVLQLINKAYDKRNLWAMREVEHSLVEHALAKCDTPESKLARLRERLDEIARSAMQAAERRTRLQLSEAWQLKQRTEQDSYLIEVVIHRVKQQIEAAKRLLAQKRIEYQAANF